MCLTINKDSTKRLERLLSRRGNKTFYKTFSLRIYKLDNGIYSFCLRTPYMFKTIDPSHVLDGESVILESNRKGKDLTLKEKNSGIVEHGIHVYITYDLKDGKAFNVKDQRDHFKKVKEKLLSKVTCNEYQSYNSSDMVIKVSGTKSAFISAGSNDAVFKYITIPADQIKMISALIKDVIKELVLADKGRIDNVS